MSRHQSDQESKLEPSTGIKKNPAHRHSHHFNHVTAILTCLSLIKSKMTKRKMGTIDSVSDFCICCYCVGQCSSVCVIYVQSFKNSIHIPLC